jgi:hypothetical protein
LGLLEAARLAAAFASGAAAGVGIPDVPALSLAGVALVAWTVMVMGRTITKVLSKWMREFIASESTTPEHLSMCSGDLEWII